jgi:hypothetical protein
MTRRVVRDARVRRAEDSELRSIAKVLAGLSIADLHRTGAWSSLEELSQRTEIELLDADPHSAMMLDDKRFEVAGTAHVSLHYDRGPDAVCFDESFPMVISGEALPDGDVRIDKIDIDTKSFYR